MTVGEQIADELYGLHCDIGRLEVENAKLRKLVLTLAFCANDEADCDQCPMNDARCDTVQQYFCDGAATALRELGIEVDDGTE